MQCLIKAPIKSIWDSQMALIPPTTTQDYKLTRLIEEIKRATIKTINFNKAKDIIQGTDENPSFLFLVI
jgi:hypothetical protein